MGTFYDGSLDFECKIFIVLSYDTLKLLYYILCNV